MATDEPDLDEILQNAYRYALALGHDRHLAEDLLQDACVAITRRGGPWTRSYVMAAVRNKFIDHCRREKVIAFVPLEDDVATESASDSPAEGLEAAVARLGATEREALFLSAVEGYTAQEISNFTGRPRGSVLSMIHRAKDKVRQMLRGERDWQANER